MMWESGENSQHPGSVYRVPDEIAAYVESLAAVHKGLRVPKWAPTVGRPKKPRP
jgi:hypothetical protein